MFLKNILRYHLGQIIKKTGTSEKFKTIYLYYAYSVLNHFPANSISNVWVRRSFLTSDFTPIWSDIDLTILVKHSEIKKLIYSPPAAHYPLLDIQYIYDVFFNEWKNTGGIRNKIATHWKLIKGKEVNLTGNSTYDRSFTALETAYEIFLLYKQLETLLFKTDRFSNYSKQKIVKDLFILKEFWYSGDISWLTKKRSEVTVELDIFEFLNKYETLIEDVFYSLPAEFQSFDLTALIDKEIDLGTTLFLSIDGKKVCLTNDFKKLKNKTDQSLFYCSEIFIKLIKAVGIHEQDILNRFAVRDKNSPFYQFCLQRLANDLLGAVISSNRSSLTVYYALKNINEFSIQVQQKPAPYWDSTTSKISKNASMLSNSKELAIIVSAQLDLLAALR